MENENKINEMYDKLLNITDSTSKDGSDIEEIGKQFENLKESFDQLSVEGDDITDITSFTTTTNSDESDEPLEIKIDQDQTSNTVYANGETTVMTSYNPETGEQMVMDDFNGAEDVSNKHFDAFIKDGKVDLSSIENIMNSKELKDFQDSAKIASLIQRRMNGESFNYYEELPDSIKQEVSKLMTSLNYKGTNKKPFNKNYVAKLIIDDMVDSYKKESQKEMEFDLDTLLAGFDKDVEKMQNEFATDLGNIMMSFDEERKAEIDAGIKRCEESGNTEAADRLRKIKDTVDKAYNLDEFAEFCLHCKIKNYDLEKPSRIYDYFNYKYINHKNTINDIRSCPSILDRHMPDIDHKYKVMICLAFCKYCQDMSPDNIEDHTFMYYFIRNIIAIDRINPKGIGYNTMDERSKKFYDEFTSNLKKCIFNLLERNVTLK